VNINNRALKRNGYIGNGEGQPLEVMTFDAGYSQPQGAKKFEASLLDILRKQFKLQPLLLRDGQRLHLVFAGERHRHVDSTLSIPAWDFAGTEGETASIEFFRARVNPDESLADCNASYHTVSGEWLDRAPSTTAIEQVPVWPYRREDDIADAIAAHLNALHAAGEILWRGEAEEQRRAKAFAERTEEARKNAPIVRPQDLLRVFNNQNDRPVRFSPELERIFNGET
jgi:hypothetical protein